MKLKNSDSAIQEKELKTRSWIGLSNSTMIICDGAPNFKREIHCLNR
jgi:hypothetical protein